jgi:hypothetical protein
MLGFHKHIITNSLVISDMGCYRASPTGQKQKSEKQLSLLFFPKFFLIFLEFRIFEMCKRLKIKYAVENKKMQMAEKGGKNQILDNYRFNLLVRASHFSSVSKIVSIP